MPMTPDELDDRELLRRLKSGSRAAFELLLDRCERRVYNLALRMLGDPSDAEDATQDIFVEVHRSLPRFRGDSRLDTWVHRIAVNVCLQRRRKHHVTTVELVEQDLGAACDGDPFREAARGELRDVVACAVRRLPEGQQEVVLLHGMQGLSYSEVARALGCPVGTVKSRLSSAFKKLRESLEDYVVGDAIPIGPEPAPARAAP